MLQKINTPVSVLLLSDHQSHQVTPKRIRWEGRTYAIIKVGLHHTFREGRVLFHVFSVESETLFFRLVFNTDDLTWRVEEISDGEL